MNGDLRIVFLFTPDFLRSLNELDAFDCLYAVAVPSCFFNVFYLFKWLIVKDLYLFGCFFYVVLLRRVKTYCRVFCIV